MGRRLYALAGALLLAVLGVIGVITYVDGANNRALAAEQPMSVLVAKAQIPAGMPVAEAMSKGSLGLEQFARKAIPAGALRSSVGLRGEVALTTVYEGQVIMPGLFGQATAVASGISVPAGDVVISLALDEQHRVGSFLAPGSQVALFDTFTNRSATGQPFVQSGAGLTHNPPDDQVTRLLLPKVLVVATGSTTTASGPQQSSTSTSGTSGNDLLLVSVAVSQSEAQQVILARETGVLTAALLSADSKVTPGAGTDQLHLFGGGS